MSTSEENKSRAEELMASVDALEQAIDEAGGDIDPRKGPVLVEVMGRLIAKAHVFALLATIPDIEFRAVGETEGSTP